MRFGPLAIGLFLLAQITWGSGAGAQDMRQRIKEASVSNAFYQTDLSQAITEIGLETGINIVVASSTLFVTDAVLEDQSVEEALQLLLAGTGLVYDVQSSYILVYDPREVDQYDTRNISDFYQPLYFSPTEARAMLPLELQQFAAASDQSGLVRLYGPGPVVQSLKARLHEIDVYDLQTEFIVTRNITPSAIKAALPRNFANFVTFDNESGQLIVRAPGFLLAQIREFVTQLETNAGQTALNSMPGSFEIYHPSAYEPEDLLQLMPPALRQYVQVTGASDVLTISANPEVVGEILEIFRLIDHKPAQVLLSAKIISMSNLQSSDIGAQVGLPQIQIGSAFFRDLTNTLFTPWAISAGYSPSQTFTNALSVNLRMLEGHNSATILSSPSVASLNNEEAEISFASTVAQTIDLGGSQGEGEQTTALRELTGGTTLRITPKVLGDGDIQLKINADLSDFNTSNAEIGSEETARSASATVIVEDGGTAIIAGLSLSKKTSSISGLPGLSSLFTRFQQEDQTVKLSILITAKTLMSASEHGHAQPVMMRMSKEAYSQSLADELRRVGF